MLPALSIFVSALYCVAPRWCWAVLVASFVLAHWPDDPPSFRLLAPTIIALFGTWDTLRCLRARWSFYHGAVMMLLYMDIMAISMILFLLIYPWGEWLK